MTSEQIVTLLLAIVAASGTSIVTGLFGMPKLRAESKATQTGGEVAISGDAREWAKTFADRAEKAEDRADKAEARAERAEEHAEQLDTRCDELEAKLLRLAAYTRSLQAEMTTHGWTPPEPPPDLRPPL